VLSLRRKADFHTLFQHGRRAYGPWAVLYARLRPSSAPGLPAGPSMPATLAPSLAEASKDEGVCPPGVPRLAVSTTGKFPNAVQRNRARRLLRETSRLLISGLREPWDLLLIVRPAILTTTFPDRRRAILDLLRQAGIPVEQAGPGSAGVSPAPDLVGKNCASCPPVGRGLCPSDPEGTLGVPKGTPPKEPVLT